MYDFAVGWGDLEKKKSIAAVSVCLGRLTTTLQSVGPARYEAIALASLQRLKVQGDTVPERV